MRRQTTTHSTATPLHSFIRKCKSAAQLRQFIAQIGEEKAVEYATTLDDKIGLPIHVAASLRYSPQEEEAIYQILIDLTNKQATYKRFQDPIDFQETTARFAFVPNSLHQRALEIACTVTNLARASIWESSTHANLSGIELQDLKKIEMKITDAHLTGNTNAHRIVLENAQVDFQEITTRFVTLEAKLTPEVFERYIEARAKAYIKNGSGNCADICLLARYFFSLYFKNASEAGIHANIFRLQKTDHVFLIIRVGKQAALDLNQQTIICDVLNGDIFPGSDANHRLKHFVPCLIPKKNTFYNYHFYIPYDPKKDALVECYPDNLVQLNYSHEEDSCLRNFLHTINSARDYALFCELVEDDVFHALNSNLITNAELMLFTNRVADIILIFQHKDIMRLLSRKLITLSDLAKMDDTGIQKCLEHEGRRLQYTSRIANQPFAFQFSGNNSPGPVSDCSIKKRSFDRT